MIADLNLSITFYLTLQKIAFLRQEHSYVKLAYRQVFGINSSYFTLRTSDAISCLLSRRIVVWNKGTIRTMSAAVANKRFSV